MKMRIKITKIIDSIFLHWFYIVNLICRGWWRGMDNQWINIPIYVGTISLYTAIPFIIYRQFGDLGFYSYLFILIGFSVSIPFTLAIYLEEYINIEKENKDA